MAMLVRRASFSSRPTLLPLLLRDARHLSSLVPRRPPLGPLRGPPSAGRGWGSLGWVFGGECRRDYAKGRKSKDGSEAVGEVPDIGPTVTAAALAQMEAAMDALSRELVKLRTGSASAGMLDHISVETSGVNVAVVSVIDAKTLSITPYDPNSLKGLEHALVTSP